MIEKGISQVVHIKNCDENSKLVHEILNGGSICSTSVVQIAAILLTVRVLEYNYFTKESYIILDVLHSRNSMLVRYLVPGRIVSAYALQLLSTVVVGLGLEKLVGRFDCRPHLANTNTLLNILNDIF